MSAPEPQRVPLPHGARYYFPDILGQILFDTWLWADMPIDHRLMERGLVYLNEDDAIKCAELMLGIEGGEQ